MARRDWPILLGDGDMPMPIYVSLLVSNGDRSVSIGLGDCLAVMVRRARSIMRRLGSDCRGELIVTLPEQQRGLEGDMQAVVRIDLGGLDTSMAEEGLSRLNT